MSSASRGLAPREGLECLLVKMGCKGPLVEPRHGPQAGKFGDPRFQNTDSDMVVGLFSTLQVSNSCLFLMIS